MATNVTVYDLDNYPDNSKTVTTDLKVLTPVGYEGDEQWVLSFITSGYSNNTDRTAIQDIYIRETKAGWYKSSGFTGTNGKFTLVSGTSNQLYVKMDASTYSYKIELDAGINITGETIATDMQAKIRAIPDSTSWNTVDDGYALSYVNALVQYTGGKFWIVSGSIGKYYTGTSRTSVDVSKYSSNTCFETLGFDLGVSSEDVGSTSITEVLLASNYTAGAGTLSINSGLDAASGDCLVITDGINTDYFQAITISGTTITVPVSGTNGFDSIVNSYIAGVSKVQVLRIQDPDQEPKAFHSTIDSVARFGISSISNQLDFSS